MSDSGEHRPKRGGEPLEVYCRFDGEDWPCAGYLAETGERAIRIVDRERLAALEAVAEAARWVLARRLPHCEPSFARAAEDALAAALSRLDGAT